MTFFCFVYLKNALKEVNTEDEYDVYVEKFTVIAEFYESIIAVPGLHVRAPIVPELVSFLLSDFHRWTPNQNLAIMYVPQEMNFRYNRFNLVQTIHFFRYTANA